MQRAAEQTDANVMLFDQLLIDAVPGQVKYHFTSPVIRRSACWDQDFGRQVPTHFDNRPIGRRFQPARLRVWMPWARVCYPAGQCKMPTLGVVAERSEVAVFVLRHYTRMIAN